MYKLVVANLNVEVSVKRYVYDSRLNDTVYLQSILKYELQITQN